MKFWAICELARSIRFRQEPMNCLIRVNPGILSGSIIKVLGRILDENVTVAIHTGRLFFRVRDRSDDSIHFRCFGVRVPGPEGFRNPTQSAILDFQERHDAGGAAIHLGGFIWKMNGRCLLASRHIQIRQGSQSLQFWDGAPSRTFYSLRHSMSERLGEQLFGPLDINEWDQSPFSVLDSSSIKYLDAAGFWRNGAVRDQFPNARIVNMGDYTRMITLRNYTEEQVDDLINCITAYGDQGMSSTELFPAFRTWGAERGVIPHREPMVTVSSLSDMINGNPWLRAFIRSMPEEMVLDRGSDEDEESQPEESDRSPLVIARTASSYADAVPRDQAKQWVCESCGAEAYTVGEGITPMRWRVHTTPILCQECSGNHSLFNYTWSPGLFDARGAMLFQGSREIMFLMSPELEYNGMWKDTSPLSPREFHRVTGWAPCHDSSCGFELKGPALIVDRFGRMKNGIPDELKLVIRRSDANNCGGHMNISSNFMSLRKVLAASYILLPFFCSIWPQRARNNQCLIPRSNWRLTLKKQAISLRPSRVEIRIIPAYRSPEMVYQTASLLSSFIGSMARTRIGPDCILMNEEASRRWLTPKLKKRIVFYGSAFSHDRDLKIAMIKARSRNQSVEFFDNELSEVMRPLSLRLSDRIMGILS